MRVKNLTGQRFDRLIVLHRVENTLGGRTRWRCLCDCGKETNVCASNLLSGITTSCGCYRSELTGERNRRIFTTHGMGGINHRASEYRSWACMKNRCNNPNDPAYRYYGGRGVHVCERWQVSFENFLADMGFKPEPSYSIDRIDPNGDYGPENCRWASKFTQVHNRRKQTNVESENGKI